MVDAAVDGMLIGFLLCIYVDLDCFLHLNPACWSKRPSRSTGLINRTRCVHGPICHFEARNPSVSVDSESAYDFPIIFQVFLFSKSDGKIIGTFRISRNTWTDLLPYLPCHLKVSRMLHLLVVHPMMRTKTTQSFRQFEKRDSKMGYDRMNTKK